MFYVVYKKDNWKIPVALGRQTKAKGDYCLIGDGVELLDESDKYTTSHNFPLTITKYCPNAPLATAQEATNLATSWDPEELV